MTNVSANTSSSSLSSRAKIFSNAQPIAWSFAFSAQAVAVVLGNMLAIALFAFNKKLRKKKSLYLVMNMAFADLMLGGIYLPSSIFFLVTPENQASYEISFFRNIICAFFSLASPMTLYSYLCLYILLLVLTICGLNIGIWRKFKQKTPCHQQNRAFQKQRLTKGLLYVSAFTLISWIPISLCNLIGSFGYNIHDHILLLAYFMYLSSSFINPVVYAIRIPEIKQALPNFCGATVVDKRLRCFSVFSFKVTFIEIKAIAGTITKNMSASTSSLNNSFSAMVMDELLSEAQVIAWSCALASEAVVIVLGNLLTIVLFTFNRKLRNKKRLYLVINMAFADLVLGGASLPLFVYLITATRRLCFTEFPTFFIIIFTVSSMASFTTAALICAERFYAIFWPLKHRTLSTRAYKLVVLMAWTLAILFSTVYILLFRLSLGGFFAFATLYGLLLIVTICSLNIVIWRKMQQKSVPCHQNRDMQLQRLTKALSLVSVGTLSSWIPAIIINFLRFFGQNIS
ncbi:unnamed protein product, partial [Porites lobata]